MQIANNSLQLARLPVARIGDIVIVRKFGWPCHSPRTMSRLSTPTITAPLRQRNHAYLVHGAVHEISGHGANLDSCLLDKLIQRRLKRLERVLASHGGRLVKPLQQGLLASFHSAEAALIGACEMQRRCAVIPQLSDTQLALKIGIHAAIGQPLSNPAMATAAKLSTLITDAGIVLSENVIAGLPSELQQKSAPVANEGSDIAAYVIDWNAIPMHRPPPPVTEESEPAQAGTHGLQLILCCGSETYRFDSRQSIVTIGRDPGNDIVVNSPKASRKHCRIVYRLGSYVLVDVSTNGTFVAQGSGEEHIVRKNMATLHSPGRLGFGRPWQPEAADSFGFEIVRPG